MFKLEIETDNSAFADDAGAELARILRAVAGTAERHLIRGLQPTGATLHDSNGNRVGSWSYVEESSE
jgi:hypothetical protein